MTITYNAGPNSSQARRVSDSLQEATGDRCESCDRHTTGYRIRLLVGNLALGIAIGPALGIRSAFV